MQLFAYQENPQSFYRPGHPLVCVVDMCGAGIAIAFFWLAHTSVLQFYFLAMCAMYIVSCVYHWLPHSAARLRCDHTTIYLLIVCTALPFWVGPLAFSAPQLGYWLVATLVLLGVPTFWCAGCSKKRNSLVFLAPTVPFVIHFVIQWSQIGQPWNTIWMSGTALYALSYAVFFFHWFDFKVDLFGFREMQHFLLLPATTIQAYVAYMIL